MSSEADIVKLLAQQPDANFSDIQGTKFTVAGTSFEISEIPEDRKTLIGPDVALLADGIAIHRERKWAEIGGLGTRVDNLAGPLWAMTKRLERLQKTASELASATKLATVTSLLVDRSMNTPSPASGELESRLRDLIGQYFDLGYAEGAAGRDADTMAGDAQAAWSEIDALISSLVAERDRLQRENDINLEELGRIIMALPSGTRSDGALIGVKALKRRMVEAERLLAEARAALETIACHHVTMDPLWWQLEARSALRDMGAQE